MVIIFKERKYFDREPRIIGFAWGPQSWPVIHFFGSREIA